MPARILRYLLQLQLQILSFLLQRLSYGLKGRGSIPSKGKIFFRFHNIQVHSASHLASYIVGTSALSPEVKQPGREVDCSPPSSVEVKNGGAMSLLFHTSS
jgi:hypothetical protein